MTAPDYLPPEPRPLDPGHASWCRWPAVCVQPCPRALDPKVAALLKADADQRIAAGQTIDLTAGPG